MAKKPQAYSVIDCLKRAGTRDSEKGGDGSRTTREVADYCEIPLAKARRQLWAAAERNEVAACDAGGASTRGNEIFWTLNK